MTDNHAPDFIKGAIEYRIKQEADKLIEKAKKDLEERTPEIVASVVVNIMQMVEFKTMENRVIFTITKP